MLIICFRCGTEKKDPLGVCAACKSQPGTEEEIVLSVLLTEYSLDRKTLTEVAESDSRRDPKKISKAAYDLIANFLREEGLLPNKT